MSASSHSDKDDYVFIPVLCFLTANKDRRSKLCALPHPGTGICCNYLKLTFRLSPCRTVLQVPGKAIKVPLQWLVHLCQPSFHFKSSRIACGKWIDREVWPLVLFCAFISFVMFEKGFPFFFFKAETNSLQQNPGESRLNRDRTTRMSDELYWQDCIDRNLQTVWRKKAIVTVSCSVAGQCLSWLQCLCLDSRDKVRDVNNKSHPFWCLLSKLSFSR